MRRIRYTFKRNSGSEDNPQNWSEGFVVAHFDRTGRLLDPEFCRVIDGAAYFRGQIVSSKSGLKSPQKSVKKSAA